MFVNAPDLFANKFMNEASCFKKCVLNQALLISCVVDDVFYMPKGQILVGATARGYKYGSSVVRRACVTVAAESEASVAIENVDPFKSAVAEKLSAPSSVASEKIVVELADLGAADGDHQRVGGNDGSSSESNTGSNGLMSSMMTKALQAAASVASDYRGSNASTSSSLSTGAPPSAENLTASLSETAHELRRLLETSASSDSATESDKLRNYHFVTKLVRVRLTGVMHVHLRSFSALQC